MLKSRTRRRCQHSFVLQGLLSSRKHSTKSGIFPENTKSFLDLCKSYNIKNIDGLMCIPPINEDPIKHFQIITELTEECELGRPSIGMSSDYEHALGYDPKYIRVGTALFGKRL